MGHAGDGETGSRSGGTPPSGDAPLISAFADRWTTVRPTLRVLAVVHNVTSATRLFDVLGALESDPRVQVVATWTRSSIFAHGVPDLLDDIGLPIIPWDDAVRMRFDLAITTSLGGDLHRLNAPIIRLPHGMGYNKFLKPETGNRKPETGNRKPETGNPVFGLSPEWLLHDGRLVPSAIVLSHEEQRDRLAADCPEAVPATLVAGDPCYDRLVASVPKRSSYRAALGLTDAQRLVLVSSTWGACSLFGRYPRLARRLLGELPLDEFRVAIALHPNIWHGHGPGQVRAWLADARRAGLLVIPPREGWRAAVVASDVVVGDHGSVSYYAAAIGRPVVLDHGGADAVHADSPIRQLLRQATGYDPRRSVRSLIRAAEESVERTTATADRWVSSEPGRSLTLLRRAMYAIMGAREPDTPVVVDAVPRPQPGNTAPSRAMWVTVRGAGSGRGPAPDPGAEAVSVRRLPAAVVDRLSPADSDGSLMVWESEPQHRLTELADTVVCPTEDLPTDGDTWCADVFRHRAGPAVAAHYDSSGCLLRLRSGLRLEVRVDAAPPGFDPSLLVAVLADRLAHGAAPEDVAPRAGRALDLTAGATASVTFHSVPGPGAEPVG